MQKKEKQNFPACYFQSFFFV